MENTGFPASLSAIHEWLTASRASAEERLPDLLDLPADGIERVLEIDPRMCTAGVLEALTAAARDARTEGYARRSHELTDVIVTTLIPRVNVPGGMEAVAASLFGQAWIEHAKTLRAVRRHDDARRAIGVARDLLQQVPASGWFLAVADLAEASMLFDAGEREAALLMVRAAAGVFDLYGDAERLVEARMTEAHMLSECGEDAAATRVWETMVSTAQQRGDKTLMARAGARSGIAELRHGRPDEAAALLASAVDVFVAAGFHRETRETRAHLADALARCGRLHEAISEYNLLRGELLAAGRIREAALAAVASLGLLLAAGRDDELPSVTEKLVATFEAVFRYNALVAFTWLRARAAAEALAEEDLEAVRRYFTEYGQQPNTAFEPPE